MLAACHQCRPAQPGVRACRIHTSGHASSHTCHAAPEPSETQRRGTGGRDTNQQILNAAIAALAIPALGTELLEPLLSACDTAFVGRLDTEQLAGVGLASSVFTYTFLFFNFLSTASAPLIAQALARDDEAGARGTAGNAISLALLLGAACCLLLETNAERAIALVSGTSAASGASGVAVGYLRVRALGIPFSLLSTALGGIFRGRLDTRTPLIVAAGANAVNLALDPLLIFGFGPVSAYAAPGAAAATVVAETVAALALLSKLKETPLWPQGLRALGLPAWRDVREFAGASGAVLLRTAALQSTLLLATATVARHAGSGAAEVAAHQVTLQTFFLLSYLMDALAVAANGLVADSLGRDDIPRARAAAERCVLFGGGVAAAVAVGVGLAPGGVAAVFTDSTDVQQAAKQALLVVAAMQPLNAVTFIGDGIFQGAADFRYLAASMVGACALASAAMFCGGGGGGVGLTEVWTALLLLQGGRAVTIVLRYADRVPAFGGSPLTLRRRAM